MTFGKKKLSLQYKLRKKIIMLSLVNYKTFGNSEGLVYPPLNTITINLFITLRSQLAL